MENFSITDEQIQQFQKDGYLFVPGLLNSEETDLLYRIAKADQEMLTKAKAGHGRDAEGKVTSILIHNDLNDDIYSAIVRSRKVVETMEKLLGGEVYHYHNKM